jgi:thiamine transport system ATP-binding protein
MLTCDCAVFRNGGFSLATDIKIEPNGVFAVIGPSGAGKSTLLGGLAGFVSQTGGRLIWNGGDITKAEPANRPMSMVFQDSNLFPHLTVLQNVALACAPKLRPSFDVKERVEDMLERVGLGGLSGRKPGALSGGQQSRAALARALLRDRPIMLMDEPFSALGPALKDQMLDLSVDLARDAGRTIIMVTHHPADAARVADNIIGVADGRAWTPTSTRVFFDAPPEPFKDYLG